VRYPFPYKLYRKDGIHKDVLSKEALQEILRLIMCLKPSPYSATHFWISGDIFFHLGFMDLKPRVTMFYLPMKGVTFSILFGQ